MYQLTAVFNRSCLDEVLAELKEHAIEGVTISDGRPRPVLSQSQSNVEAGSRA